jgi:hypothetical protein
MTDKELEHPTTYRKEVLDRLFGCIKSGDSFFVIGGASAGKTRLMDFIMREPVQRHYLEDQAQKTLLIRVDLNRHHEGNDWHFFELLLSSLMLGCSQHKSTSDFFEQLVDLDRQVLESRDFLLALRLFELAVHMLCKNLNIKVCFIFDEFDWMYKNMPKEFFDHLRAVRDANKYKVCFGLFLRDLPDRLRDKSENESFYELISHRLIGLGPYNPDDAKRVLQQMEERREHPLSQKWRDAFVFASGGHPGLLQALLSMHINLSKENERMGDLNWVAKQEFIIDECEKIWGSLAEEEHLWLVEAVRGNIELIPLQEFKLLTAKGILKKQGEEYKVFSAVFDLFLQEKL